jgi:hypothetical protein
VKNTLQYAEKNEILSHAMRLINRAYAPNKPRLFAPIKRALCA